MTPERARYLMECTRQWSRWIAGMDNIDDAPDHCVTDVASGVQAATRERIPSDQPLQPREDFLRSQRESGYIWPQDQKENP